MALALPLAAGIAYAPVLRAGYIWDDDTHVTRPDLRSLAGLRRIWTEPGATAHYNPILNSAFWAEHRLWGDSAQGYHALNLALHAGVAFLLFLLLRRLAVPGAALAAAAFAVHPVTVESVAWISEQRNTLAGVWALGAALAYQSFDRRRRPGWYALATALFVLALLTMSATATLPAALLVIFWWRRGRLGLRRDVVPLLPWFGLGAAAAVATAWMERTFVGAYGPAPALDGAQRLLLAGRAAWFYLGKVVWPARLVFFYPRWILDPRAPGQYLYPAAALGVLAALFLLRRRTRGPLAAALLFVGLLFPALGFINVYPFVFSFVADRFQYLAAAAAIAALVAGLVWVDGRLPPLARHLGRAFAGCVLLGLGSMTFLQARSYHDPEFFYRSILADNPEGWLAHANLAVILDQNGGAVEAMVHCQAAMALNPNYSEPFNHLGDLLARQRNWPAAAAAYAGAVRARPTFAMAEYNWGCALAEQGRYLEAEPHLRRAIRLRPDYAPAHYVLANALGNAGLAADAQEEYRAALRYQPEYPEASANLGLALAEDGKWPEALPYIEQAVRLRPGYAEARAYYGFALAQSGRYAEAVEEYRQSLRLGTDNAGLHYQLADVLRRLGRPEEADDELDRAHRLQDQEAAAAR